MPTSKTIKVLLLGILVTFAGGRAMSQTTPDAPKPELVRLKLSDGSYLAVDEAWETSQGIWYRQGSLSHLAPKDRVKSIERGDPAPPPEPKQANNHNSNNNDGPLYMRPVEKPPEPVVESNHSGNYEKPVWIYLVGGARVEADSANESASGVWLKRGAMSVFIERSRLDRIELEDAEKIAVDESGKKERGWSTGRAGLDSLIRQNGIRHGVDPYLIFLVMEQESHFNPRVVSPKGARGLMQLMPGTGARFGVRHPFDPAQNISGGTRYLRELLNRFDNRVDLVLASYNAGEGAVLKFGHKVPPYKETRNYVKQISYRYRRLPAKTKAASGE
ncbi:MAG TPA: lytic transglycosylase domain-containing protein [Pyrinomonadaceae bacterium]